MNALTLLTGIVVLALLVYLVVALLNPEAFE
ncbi:K(+)-transporting ATPase subunit F [Humidesulfovibrio sp.]